MSAEDERTIPVTLDNLDYEACALGGFTHKELVMTFGVLAVGFLIPSIPIAHLFLGHFAFGLMFSFLMATLLTAHFSRKAYLLKNGRPSYMLWVDLQRKIQTQGIFGIKLNMGFVETTYWHTGPEKKKGKQ
ncbi:DUF3487 family protein [Vibrio sp.]|uniref:DUF3487 family protein n=1 Tax=Vibrio sp. TaxID=678 RepID=UPI003D0A44AF